ncbi:MAG: putative membrane protein [Nitrospira sp.]|nr:MAG: putative membrane protein [Nitrospira sp.]
MRQTKPVWCGRNHRIKDEFHAHDSLSVLYLKEPLKRNYLVGFGMMGGAVFFVFKES